MVKGGKGCSRRLCLRPFVSATLTIIFIVIRVQSAALLTALIKLRIDLQYQQGAVGGSADGPFSVSATLTTIFIVTGVQSAALLTAQSSFPQVPITT